MANNKDKIAVGIKLDPQGSSSNAAKGDMEILSSDGLLYVHDGSTNNQQVNLATAQTLTNKTLSGASNTFSNISLTTGVTGTLPIGNGGTNITTYTTGDTLYASATNVLSKLAIGTTGQVLTVAAGLPSWSTVSVSANVGLSNLASTAVNVAISPATTLATDLGSSSKYWNNLYTSQILLEDAAAATTATLFMASTTDGGGGTVVGGFKGLTSGAATGGMGFLTANQTGVASGLLRVTSGSTTGNFASGALNIQSGNTTGTSASGTVNIGTGNGTGATGTGNLTVRTGNGTSSAVSSGNLVLGTGTSPASTGSVTITSGTAGGGTGNTSGVVNIASGTTSNETSGAVSFKSGQGTLANSGIVTIASGLSNGTGFSSGAVNITSGIVNSSDSGASGAVTITSGVPTSTNISSGPVTHSTGAVTGSGVSGDISVTTGTTSGGGTSGAVSMATGASTSGNSGALTIASGATTTSGTPGAVIVKTGAVAAGASGGVTTISTGSASGTTGNTGILNLNTGVGGSVSGSSGNIVIAPGTVTAGSTRGIVQLLGTTTNDSAAAGDVGEFLSTAVANGTTWPSATGVYGVATSVALTPGDWNLSGVIKMSANSATVVQVEAFVGTSSGDNNTGQAVANTSTGPVPSATTDATYCVVNFRISIAANTTYYLKAYTTYSVATPTYGAIISARRVR